jgi:hypothetical protein
MTTQPGIGVVNQLGRDVAEAPVWKSSAIVGLE